MEEEITEMVEEVIEEETTEMAKEEAIEEEPTEMVEATNEEEEKLKKRNLLAKLLRSPLFRLRSLPNKKRYNRKKLLSKILTE